MRHFKVFVFILLALFMVAGSAAFASKPAQVIWWELEAEHTDHGAILSTAEMLASLERPKKLILRQGKFSVSTHEERSGQSFTVDNARVWIRDPDGVVSEVNLSPDNGTIALNLPSDLNPGELNGRYLVGIHLDAGIMDIDSDGTDERVHLYSKFLVNYRKQGGAKGENPGMFFNDEDKIALEIGPFFPKSMFKKAGCPHADAIKGSKRSKVGFVRDGGNQTPLKEHKMKVFYKGQPLTNTEVVILSKSGWKKTIMTDSDGAISITPPKTLARVADPGGTGRSHEKPRSGIGEGAEKDRHGGGHKAGYAGERKVGHAGRISHGNRQTAGDKLLYVVAYKDPSSGEYHCATLPMSLRMFSRGSGKWLSMSSGFASWGIIGAGLGIVGLGGGVYHRKRRNRETIFKSKKS
ncbi:MAG: hypothetical protein SRB2_03985 [Desulfobacteraceae bacterium Eth-SRB2]|nr:MAG: hypothetical protein SRB2_03985 [Desulfobacteraceae bacterium Eth-SRB2]